MNDVTIETVKFKDASIHLYRRGGPAIMAKWSVAGRWKRCGLGTNSVDEARLRGMLVAKQVALGIAEPVGDSLAAAAAAIQQEGLRREPQSPPGPYLVRGLGSAKVVGRSVSREVAGTASVPVAKATTIKEAAASNPTAIGEATKRQKDYRAAMGAIDSFCQFAGYTDLAKLRSGDVARWVAELTKGGLSPTTARNRIKGLRWASAMAPEHGLADVLRDRKLISGMGKAEFNVLAWKEIRKVLAFLKDDHEGLAVVGLLVCGLRPSETARARPTDLVSGTLSVPSPKPNAPDRTIPMPPSVVAFLKGSESWCPVPESKISKWLRRRLEGCDVKDHTPHDFRSSLMTNLVRNGVDPGLVDAYVGHAVRTVSKVSQAHYFAGYTVDNLKPVASAIEAAIQGS